MGGKGRDISKVWRVDVSVSFDTQMTHVVESKATLPSSPALAQCTFLTKDASGLVMVGSFLLICVQTPCY